MLIFSFIFKVLCCNVLEFAVDLAQFLCQATALYFILEKKIHKEKKKKDHHDLQFHYLIVLL